jgi:hypothetical protein
MAILDLPFSILSLQWCHSEKVSIDEESFFPIQISHLVRLCEN